ncbi:hypothetical protein [Enhygromyxa salina]|nr:hypothetical protein [Enhygromyxa salina]
MARLLRLTALASVLAALACANKPEPGGGPSADAQTGLSAKGHPVKPAKATEPPGQPDALVPLASAPEGARPCERMCGRVGDCLRERGDKSDASHLRDAGHLELTCLDLCVNVSPTSDAGKRFRGCESRDSCDPLLDCTRQEWDAAAKARTVIVTQIDAAPSHYGTCELVCGGMYACHHYDRPLHQVDSRSQQFEQDVRSCMYGCDPGAEAMMEYAECAREHSCNAQWECWSRASSRH